MDLDRSSSINNANLLVRQCVLGQRQRIFVHTPDKLICSKQLGIDTSRHAQLFKAGRGKRIKERHRLQRLMRALSDVTHMLWNVPPA
jgi:hypothetical protein